MAISLPPQHLSKPGQVYRVHLLQIWSRYNKATGLWPGKNTPSSEVDSAWKLHHQYETGGPAIVNHSIMRGIWCHLRLNPRYSGCCFDWRIYKTDWYFIMHSYAYLVIQHTFLTWCSVRHHKDNWVTISHRWVHGNSTWGWHGCMFCNMGVHMTQLIQNFSFTRTWTSRQVNYTSLMHCHQELHASQSGNNSPS